MTAADVNTEREDRQVSYELLGILIRKAPDRDAQEIASRLHSDLANDLTNTWEYIASVLAGAVQDGYAHGNWPWTNYKIETEK